MRTAIATKFVAWEVPSLENLQGSKVYGLRTKLNNGEKLSRDEKDWLTRNVNCSTYFTTALRSFLYGRIDSIVELNK